MRKIAVAVCLDNERGMTFFGKRQSRDRVLCKEFLESQKQRNIYINEFTKPLFEASEQVRICKEPLEEAEDGSVVFSENLDILPYLDEINEFIIYWWNRDYPSDKIFSVELDKEGFKLASVHEFEGSSHDNIRKEIYIR